MKLLARFSIWRTTSAPFAAYVLAIGFLLALTVWR